MRRPAGKDLDTEVGAFRVLTIGTGVGRMPQNQTTGITILSFYPARLRTPAFAAGVSFKRNFI